MYLSLHACAGRTLMVSDSVLQVQGLNRIEPETIVSRGNFINELYGGKISDGTTTVQFENQRTSAVEGTDGTKGSFLVKILFSRKILQEAAGKKAWKRSGQSKTLESPPSNGEETANPKDNRVEEDVVVMDYEQPHRKPPIHNWEP
ncbi:hypothetical protein F511_11985 [Dorcoceras hygrometricum]|uniref:Uncharacterized protein n=1 Tax=Dorcoceras hygrometricum TaxID=472368 RepID=A0A2Z7BRF9_9LAMI|nr:hypothetical protein F511_11985 [Dorcoceras hygrometricum]